MNGRFELSGAVADDEGRMRCNVWKEGYESGDHYTTLENSKTGDWRIEVKKYGDLSFSGTALFADGSPVANDEFQLYLKGYNYGSSMKIETDTQGRFRGSLKRPGQFSVVVAWIEQRFERFKGGGISVSKPHRWRADIQKLETGVHAYQWVFENRGRIEVRLDAAELSPTPESLELICSLSATGEDWPHVYNDIAGYSRMGPLGGLAVFDQLTCGQYTITVAEPDGPQWREWKRTVQLPLEGGTWSTTIDWKLKDSPTGIVKALLRLSDEGFIPVDVKAGVRLRNRKWIDLSMSGDVIMDRLPVGDYDLTIHGQEILTTTRLFSIRADETTNLGEIVLSHEKAETGWIEGRILFEDGVPALGARIHDYTRRPGEATYVDNVVQADGNYRVQLQLDSTLVGVDLDNVSLWPRCDIASEHDIVNWPDTQAAFCRDRIWAPVKIRANQTIQRDIIIPQSNVGKIKVKWLGEMDVGRLNLMLVVRGEDFYFTCSPPPSFLKIRSKKEKTEIFRRLLDQFESIPAGDRYFILQTDHYAGYHASLESKGDVTFIFDPSQVGSISGFAPANIQKSSTNISLHIDPDDFSDIGYVKSKKGLEFFGPGIVVDGTKIDESGAFRFPKIAPGKYVIKTGDSEMKIARVIEVVAGRETVVDFKAEDVELE